MQTQHRRYPIELKESVVRRYLSTEASFRELAEEIGTSTWSVRAWVREYQAQGTVGKRKNKKNKSTPDARSPEEKLQLIIQAKALSDSKRGEFLRREGIRDGDLQRWEQDALAGLKAVVTPNAVAIERVNSVYLQNDDNRFGQASFENRWVCWEFEIDQTGGMGKVKPTIWLDGEKLSLRKAGSASHGETTDSWDPIDFKYIWVGLFGYQGSRESYDYWVDDLIVDSERIGCPDAK